LSSKEAKSKIITSHHLLFPVQFCAVGHVKVTCDELWSGDNTDWHYLR